MGPSRDIAHCARRSPVEAAEDAGSIPATSTPVQPQGPSLSRGGPWRVRASVALPARAARSRCPPALPARGARPRCPPAVPGPVGRPISESSRAVNGRKRCLLWTYCADAGYNRFDCNHSTMDPEEIGHQGMNRPLGWRREWFDPPLALSPAIRCDGPVRRFTLFRLINADSQYGRTEPCHGPGGAWAESDSRGRRSRRMVASSN
jgi:hypothetical protein